MNLIRNLLGLFIVSLMLEVTMLGYNFVANIRFDYNSINDDISIAQLRRILLISYDLNSHGDSLNFIYKNKDFSLSMVNGKLILQPGTQIFLNDVDEVHFENEYGVYKLIYFRKGKEYEKVLCQTKGIYIDDFSDCDVLYDGDYNSED